MDENRKKLYDQLSQNWNVGTWEEFDRDLDDENNQQVAWNAVGGQDGYGDFDLFKQSIQRSPKQEVVNQPEVQQVEQQPTVEVTPTVETKVEEKPEVTEPKVEVTDTEQEQTTTTELAPAADVTPVEQTAPKVDYTAMSDGELFASIGIGDTPTKEALDASVANIMSIEDPVEQKKAIDNFNACVNEINRRAELASQKHNDELKAAQQAAKAQAAKQEGLNKEIVDHTNSEFDRLTTQKAKDGKTAYQAGMEADNGKLYNETVDNIKDEKKDNLYQQMVFAVNDSTKSDEERAVIAAAYANEMEAREKGGHAHRYDGEYFVNSWLDSYAGVVGNEKADELRKIAKAYNDGAAGYETDPNRNVNGWAENPVYAIPDLAVEIMKKRMAKSRADYETTHPAWVAGNSTEAAVRGYELTVEMLKAADPAACIEEAMQMFGNDNYLGYVLARSRRWDIQPEQANEESYNWIYNRFMAKVTKDLRPDDNVTYILDKLLTQNFAARLVQAAASMQARYEQPSLNKQQNLITLHNQALQQYEALNSDGFWNSTAQIFSNTGVFLMDGVLFGAFWFPGKAAQVATGVGMRILGGGTAAGARSIAENALVKYAMGVLGGSVNFGTFEFQNAFVDQLTTGEYDWSKLKAAFKSGAKKGAAFGAVGGLVEGAFRNAIGWKVYAGEAAKFGAEVGAFTAIGYMEAGKDAFKPANIGANVGMVLGSRFMHGDKWLKDVQDRFYGRKNYGKIMTVHSINDDEFKSLTDAGYGSVASALKGRPLLPHQENKVEQELKQMRADKNIPWELVRMADYVLDGKIALPPAVVDKKIDNLGDGTYRITAVDKDKRAVRSSVIVKGTEARNAAIAAVNREIDHNNFAKKEHDVYSVYQGNQEMNLIKQYADENGMDVSAAVKLWSDASQKVQEGRGKELGENESAVFEGVNKLLAEAGVVQDPTKGKISELNEKYGVNINAAINKFRGDRTEQEKAALNEYEGWLDGENTRVKKLNDAIENPQEDVAEGDVVPEASAAGAKDEPKVEPQPKVETEVKTEEVVEPKEPEQVEPTEPEEPEPPTETPPTAPEGEPTGEGESISEPLEVGGNELPIKEAPENLAGGKPADTHDIRELFLKGYDGKVDEDLLDTYLESAEFSRKAAHDYAEGKGEKPDDWLWQYWAERDGLSDPQPSGRDNATAGTTDTTPTIGETGQQAGPAATEPVGEEKPQTPKRPALSDVDPKNMSDEEIAAEIETLRNYLNNANTPYDAELVDRRQALYKEQDRREEERVQPTEQEPSATQTEAAPEATATVEPTPEAQPEVEVTEQPNVEQQRKAEEAAKKKAQAVDPYYMPMENKGGGRMSPDYDKASAEQIFNHLNDRENREQRGTLSADIEQRLKDAQARLASIEKQEPKGNNRTTSALNAWERRRDAAADRVEKWKEVKRMHDENQRTNGRSELDDRQARKVFFETDPGEAGSLREYVMRQLYGMKFKWKGLNYERTGGRTSGLGGHLGLENSEKERRGFFGWLDEKNGMTPEEVAHSIWENMPQEWSDRYDTMDILDEVLSVVGEFPRPMDMVRAFAKNHRSMAEEQADWDAGQMGYKDAGEAEADMEQQERDMASRHDALAAENEANEETADKVAELQQIANDPNRSEFERQAARSALRWRQLPDAERKRRTPLIERVKKWTRKIGGDGVVVLHSVDEIQDTYTRRMVEQSHANGQRTPGWYDKGKVYIFMPDVTDRRDVDKTMVHEVVSHKGIKGLLGEAAYNDLLDAVYASMSIEAKDEYSHYIGGKENETEVEHHRRMADEWIANNLEGTRVDNKFAEAWNNIAKYVLDTLRGWGFDISNITKTDLEHLLRESYKKLRGDAGGRDGAPARLTDGGDGVRFRFTEDKEDFDRMQKEAVEKKGMVMPSLAEKEVKVVHGDINHPFDTSLPDTSLKKQVKSYAREHSDEMLGDVPVENGIVNVSLTSLGEMADPKSYKNTVKNGVSKDVHFAAIPKIKEIIRNSIDAEVHPDYIERDKSGKRIVGKYSDHILMHRLYGAVEIDGKVYRVKTTVKEDITNKTNRAHTYEVAEIELLESHTRPADSTSPISNNSISGANLLQGVEKSYDSGKKLLDESAKTTDSGSRDAEYAAAVAAGDAEKVDRMLREEAGRKGYHAQEDYHDAHYAPYASVERGKFTDVDALREAVEVNGDDPNLFAIANGISNQPDDYWSQRGPRLYMYNDQAGYETYAEIGAAIRGIQYQLRTYGEVRDMPWVKVYRAVPEDIKGEQLETYGQWVSPSRTYAEKHGKHRFGEGAYRIIEQEVPADQLWWDGNDAREWGYDDGSRADVYKNTANNRKLLEATYDDAGNLIPLSQRFDEGKSDVRFRVKGDEDHRGSVEDAQRRLEDPNASEFEKTAARTVLRVYGGGDTPDGGNTVEDSGVRYRIKDDAERMTGEVVYKNRQARQRKDAVADFVKATADLDEMTDSKFATALGKVMRGQREYDKDTVKDITDMAKAMMDAGLLSGLDDFAVRQILTKVKDATGKEGVTKEANKLIDIMLKHQLKKGKSEFEQSLKAKGMKQDSRGVVVQGGLDYHGQRMVKALKEGLGLSDLQAINDRIDEVEQKLNDPDEVVRGNAKDELDGLYVARQYFDEIKQNELNEANVKAQLEEAKTRHKNGTMSDAAYHQFVWSCEDALRELRCERVDAWSRLNDQLGDRKGESAERAKAFREEQNRRKEEIQHWANSDLEGVDADPHAQSRKTRGQRRMDKVKHGLQLVTNPLATFDKLMRFFGEKFPKGEGNLFNFVRKSVDARDSFFKNRKQLYDQMDDAVYYISADHDMKMDSWRDIYTYVKKLPTLKVNIRGEEYPISQGQAVYLLAMEAQTDGRMKLRAMGITEADMDALRDKVDPMLLELQQWVVDELLPGMRKDLNQTHLRMFGADMSDIANYFPIRTNELARNETVNLAQQNGKIRPATITGSIIERKRNNADLDITADFFQVTAEHVSEMSHWNSFAELSRDLNTLLSYKNFRAKVNNMSSLRYGDGKQIWETLEKCCAITTGDYLSDVGTSESFLNKRIRGLAQANISLRVYTAAKQLLSSPVYLVQARWDDIIKNIANPMGTWKWAIENLPTFAERWQGRVAGDPILTQSDKESSAAGYKYNKVKQGLAKAGYFTNAAVDAMTVAIGGRSIYETKLRQYKEMGYSEEEANKKALQDAAISVNETQQSGIGTFLSPIQQDRTFWSRMVTLYRNASMGFQRELVGGLTAIKHGVSKTWREEAIRKASTKMIREGVDADVAQRVAERMANREAIRGVAWAAMFGSIAPAIWALGGQYFPYKLSGGDDNEEENEGLLHAAVHLFSGWAEGLVFGSTIGTAAEFGLDYARGKKKARDFGIDMDLFSESFEQIGQKMDGKRVEAIYDLARMFVSMGVGVDPKTIVDPIVGIMDFFGNDYGSARDFGLLFMRITNVPQSAVDQTYIDELQMTAGEAQKLPAEELAQRWATYKRRKGAGPLNAFTSEEYDKEIEDKYVKRFEKMMDARLDLYDGARLDEAMQTTDPFVKKHLVKKITKDSGLEYRSPRNEQGRVYEQLGTKEDMDLSNQFKQRFESLDSIADGYRKLGGKRDGKKWVRDTSKKGTDKEARKAYKEAHKDELDKAAIIAITKGKIDKKKAELLNPDADQKAIMQEIRKLQKEALDKTH